MLQSAINKDATTKFFFFFPPVSIECYWAPLSSIGRWRLLSLLSKALTRLELEASDPFGDAPPVAKKTSLLSEVVILTLVSFKWGR